MKVVKFFFALYVCLAQLSLTAQSVKFISFADAMTIATRAQHAVADEYNFKVPASHWKNIQTATEQALLNTSTVSGDLVLIPHAAIEKIERAFSQYLKLRYANNGNVDSRRNIAEIPLKNAILAIRADVLGALAGKGNRRALKYWNSVADFVNRELEDRSYFNFDGQYVTTPEQVQEVLDEVLPRSSTGSAQRKVNKSVPAATSWAAKRKALVKRVKAAITGPRHDGAKLHRGRFGLPTK